MAAADGGSSCTDLIEQNLADFWYASGPPLSDGDAQDCGQQGGASLATSCTGFRGELNHIECGFRASRSP